MTYISALPTPPSRSDDPTGFSNKADALLAALPDFVTEANTLSDEVDAMRDDTEAKRAATETLRDETSTLKGQAEAARDSAESYKDTTNTYRGQAEAARDSAQTIAAAYGGELGLPSLTGNALKVLRVASTETGVEWGEGSPPTFDRIAPITTTSTWVVPDGVQHIRAYAVGKGGNGVGGTSAVYHGSGGGGGMAFGTIDVAAGDSIGVTISSGVATVTKDGTTLLTANPGGNGMSTSPGTGGAGGTASKHESVYDGGAYTGGTGGTGATGGSPGGASAASPLGNGVNTPASQGGGGSGIGGAGGMMGGGGGGAGGSGGGAYSAFNAGGGAGGAAAGPNPGKGRNVTNRFTDPLLRHAIGSGGTKGAVANTATTTPTFSSIWPSDGGGGYGDYSIGSSVTAQGGADFGGGGGAFTGDAYSATGGHGGLLGGGGGAYVGGSATATAGNGGYGGGGGAAYAGSSATGGTGGPACVIILY